MKNFLPEFHLRLSAMGSGGGGGGVENVSAESKYGFATCLRVASHSAIFCACVCESKIPKMFYLFKKVRNSCVELSQTTGGNR